MHRRQVIVYLAVVIYFHMPFAKHASNISNGLGVAEDNKLRFEDNHPKYFPIPQLSGYPWQNITIVIYAAVSGDVCPSIILR